MRASDFVAAYARRGLPAWEAAAREMIKRGEAWLPPLVEVPVQTPDGLHAGSIFALGDYVAIGELGDYLRIPLTPQSAQWVADRYGALLPTSRMVDQIARAATVKLDPDELDLPNRGEDLRQILEHSRLVDQAILAATGQPVPAQGLVAGQKKDVVVSRIQKPGKVVIYGWHRPSGSRVQPKSNIHSWGYLDYSHGVRLVAPNMVVDGRSALVADVLGDPQLAPMISNEGAFAAYPRYSLPPEPSGGGGTPTPPKPGAPAPPSQAPPSSAVTASRDHDPNWEILLTWT